MGPCKSLRNLRNYLGLTVVLLALHWHPDSHQNMHWPSGWEHHQRLSEPWAQKAWVQKAWAQKPRAQKPRAQKAWVQKAWAQKAWAPQPRALELAQLVRRRARRILMPVQAVYKLEPATSCSRAVQDCSRLSPFVDSFQEGPKQYRRQRVQQDCMQPAPRWSSASLFEGCYIDFAFVAEWTSSLSISFCNRAQDGTAIILRKRNDVHH